MAAAAKDAPGAAAQDGVASFGCVICPGHARPVVDVSFSREVQDQGQRRLFLASACLDSKAMVRDGESGDWIGSFEHAAPSWACRFDAPVRFACRFGEAGACLALAAARSASSREPHYSPQALRAVTACADGGTRLWDAVTGDLLHTWSQGEGAIVRACIFSPDDRVVVSGGFEKKLFVYDVERRDAQPRVIAGAHSVPVLCIEWSDDPNVFFSSGRERGVRMWDLRADKPAAMLDTTGNVASLSMAKGGATMVVAAGKEILLFDVRHRVALTKLSSREVECAAYSPALQQVVSGSLSDTWIHVFSTQSGQEVASLRGHHGPVLCVAFAPDERSFVSGADDSSVRLWQRMDGAAAESKNGSQ
jgi:serine-threonine kinase receptor-associated protein